MGILFALCPPSLSSFSQSPHPITSAPLPPTASCSVVCYLTVLASIASPAYTRPSRSLFVLSCRRPNFLPRSPSPSLALCRAPCKKSNTALEQGLSARYSKLPIALLPRFRKVQLHRRLGDCQG